VIWLLAFIGPEEAEDLLAPCVAILVTTTDHVVWLPFTLCAGDAVASNLPSLWLALQIRRRPFQVDFVVVQCSFELDSTLLVSLPVHTSTFGQLLVIRTHTIEMLDGANSLMERGLLKEAIVLALLIHNRALDFRPFAIYETVLVLSRRRVQHIAIPIAPNILPIRWYANRRDGANDIRRTAQKVEGEEPTLGKS